MPSLAELSDANDLAAARASLDRPKLLDLAQRGEPLPAPTPGCGGSLNPCSPLAIQLGLGRWLAPLAKVADGGHEAPIRWHEAWRWLGRHRNGGKEHRVDLDSEIERWPNLSGNRHHQHRSPENPLG